MPIDAIRSIAPHFQRILKAANPKRIAVEMQMLDKGFYFRHFKGYRPDKIGRGRIKKIADREIFGDRPHEGFANMLIMQWNEANARLYNEMVTHVQAINEDVEAIEIIDDDKAAEIVADLTERHDLADIYLCVKLNGVRFSDTYITATFDSGIDGGNAGPE